MKTWLDPSLEECIPKKAYLKIMWQHFNHPLPQNKSEFRKLIPPLFGLLFKASVMF